jgi:magnesium chelatase family protein
VLLQPAPEAETSALVHERVRARQLERAGKPSSRLGLAEIERDCHLRAGDQRLFGGAIERLGLSPRAVHRILRVARTVADLAGLDVIGTPQLTEAITYRRLGRKTGS